MVHHHHGLVHGAKLLEVAPQRRVVARGGQPPDEELPVWLLRLQLLRRKSKGAAAFAALGREVEVGGQGGREGLLLLRGRGRRRRRRRGVQERRKLLLLLRGSESKRRSRRAQTSVLLKPLRIPLLLLLRRRRAQDQCRSSSDRRGASIRKKRQRQRFFHFGNGPLGLDLAPVDRVRLRDDARRNLGVGEDDEAEAAGPARGALVGDEGLRRSWGGGCEGRKGEWRERERER